MQQRRALTSPCRLAALHNTGLLETPPEDGFDALTRLAAQTVGAPTAILSLVDSDRQFFKSVFPNPGERTAGWHNLGETFCHLVVARGEAVTISDWANERPSEGQDIHAGAYAGVPLANDNGSILGTLCVIDVMPRVWTRREVDTLYAFAHAAVAEIHRRVAERATRDTQLRLVAERTLAHAVQHQMPVGVVVAESPSGRLISVNAQMTSIFMMPFTPAPDLKSYHEWVGFHENGARYSPLEWPLARTVLTSQPTSAEEIRIQRGDGTDGFIRMSASPVVDEAGKVVAAVGVVVDITDQRKAERAVRTTD